MLMLAKGKIATLDEVRAVRTPAETRTWKPIAHRDVVDATFQEAKNRGFSFDFEALMRDGTLYPERGHKIKVPNAHMYAKYVFKPHPDFQAPRGTSYSLVQINTHDQSQALENIAGGQVFVCSNGVRVGDIVVKRKHTSGLEIQEHIAAVFDQFAANAGLMHEMVNRLQGHRLGDKDAISLIVDAAEAGAIAPNKILPVVQEWRKPRHEEFQARNAWSLYNAHTEVMKSQSPIRQRDGFKALNEVFVPDLQTSLN